MYKNEDLHRITVLTTDLKSKTLTGTAVITLDKAALWTDGRTFQSAIDDIDCGWTIYRKATKTGQPAQLFKNTSKTCIKTLRKK